MKQRPEEFRQRAAQLVLDSRRSVRDVGGERGIHHETLRSWVAAERRQRADGTARTRAYSLAGSPFHPGRELTCLCEPGVCGSSECPCGHKPTHVFLQVRNLECLCFGHDGVGWSPQSPTDVRGFRARADRGTALRRLCGAGC